MCFISIYAAKYKNTYIYLGLLNWRNSFYQLNFQFSNHLCLAICGYIEKYFASITLSQGPVLVILWNHDKANIRRPF